MIWLTGKDKIILENRKSIEYFFNMDLFKIYGSIKISNDLFKVFFRRFFKGGRNFIYQIFFKTIIFFKKKQVSIVQVVYLNYLRSRSIAELKVKVKKKRRKTIKMSFTPSWLWQRIQFKKGFKSWTNSIFKRKEQKFILKLINELSDSLLLKTTTSFIEKRLLYESLFLNKRFIYSSASNRKVFYHSRWSFNKMKNLKRKYLRLRKNRRKGFFFNEKVFLKWAKKKEEKKHAVTWKKKSKYNLKSIRIQRKPIRLWKF